MDQMFWKESYSVGIALIDDQHKNLMERINELRRCVHFKRGREDIEAVLESLILFTVEHFEYEECGGPGL
jgi:hemerythrin